MTLSHKSLIAAAALTLALSNATFAESNAQQKACANQVDGTAKCVAVDAESLRKFLEDQPATALIGVAVGYEEDQSA